LTGNRGQSNPPSGHYRSLGHSSAISSDRIWDEMWRLLSASDAWVVSVMHFSSVLVAGGSCGSRYHSGSFDVGSFSVGLWIFSYATFSSRAWCGGIPLSLGDTICACGFWLGRFDAGFFVRCSVTYIDSLSRHYRDLIGISSLVRHALSDLIVISYPIGDKCWIARARWPSKQIFKNEVDWTDKMIFWRDVKLMIKQNANVAQQFCKSFHELGEHFSSK
jgi:hypothetical protein